ncbi:MAG: hypothetical protein ACKOCN_01710, partial [Planctomycetaceae bacterium]
ASVAAISSGSPRPSPRARRLSIDVGPEAAQAFRTCWVRGGERFIVESHAPRGHAPGGIGMGDDSGRAA